MESSPSPRRARLLAALTVFLLVVAASPADAAKRRAAGADLVVATVGKPPASAAAGSSLRVAFTVRNAGSRLAPGSVAGFLLSADGRRDAADVPVGSAKVAALAKRKT